MAETIKRQFGRLPVFRGPWTSDIESSDVHKFNRYTYLGSEFISTVEGNALSPGEIINGKLVEHEGWKVTANGTDPGLEAKANIETLANEAVQDVITNTTAAKDAALEAAEAANAAKDGIDAKIDNKANKDGYYGSMTVGSAENLVGRGTTEAEYVNRRTSAGTTDIGSGSAAITRIKGRSVVWNQLIQNGDFSAETSKWTPFSSTLTTDNGILTITRTFAGGTGSMAAQISKNLITTHKYYITATVLSNDGIEISFGFHTNSGTIGGNTMVNSSSRTFVKLSQLATPVNSNDVLGIRLGVASTQTDVSAKAKNIVCIDLTLLGIDNLTTVEEVEAWLAQNIGPLDYYAYNPGEVINNAAEGIKTRGFNLFNYATGKAYLPGKYSDYPYEYEICGTFTSISFTDVNGNTSVPELHEGKFFNVDAPGELTVVGGNNTDTLVHLVWSGWRNEGEPDYVYEPYWENTLNLGLTQLTGKLNGQGSSVTVFPHGLAKVGDVQDEIVGNRAIKRVGVVDMGTLDWSYNSSYGFYSSAGDRFKIYPFFLCAIYPFYGAYSNVPDKGCGYIFNNRILINDSSYSDTATFKTAISGVLLYYELATPEEYILDNPPQYNYRVDDFSTEETVPSYDPANVIAPLAYDVQYAMNAVDAIRRLPDNYVERTDVKQVTGDSQKFVLSQKAVNDNYAKKVGVEDNLTVGLAKNIEGNATSGGYPFTFVKISGTDGLAKINDVRGNSLVWNQMVQNGDFSDGTTGWSTSGATISASDNVLNWTANNATTSNRLGCSIPSINGHKYYIRFYLKGNAENQLNGAIGTISGGGAFDGVPYSTDWQLVKKIVRPTSNTDNTLYLRPNILGNEGVVAYFKDICVIDLTLMFGAGNEPSTVEEFEALFPLPYYDYNAGEIISNKTEQVKVVGFNQWDEEWEIGGINTSTGGNTGETNKIRAKNYIGVFPSQLYYYKSPNLAQFFYYDANKNFISSQGIPANSQFTIPNNCRYIRFYCISAYGTTYNHDICINLSDPAKNGTYEPYKTNTIELNLPTLTGKVNGEGESVVIASDGLKSAGSVYDEGIVENGYLTKIVKRIGVVDMGTLTWSVRSSGAEHERMYSTDLNSLVKTGSISIKANAICSKYELAISGKVYSHDKDKIFGLMSGDECLSVYDSSFIGSSAATFKSAMLGVMLYYELATPVTYVLDTPIPATFQSYKGGTLKQIPENGSVPTTAPHAMSVTYAIDAAGILTGLPQSYVSKESLQAMLTAMQNAGIFTSYTMTYNSDTGKYEFSFTANNS